MIRSALFLVPLGALCAATTSLAQGAPASSAPDTALLPLMAPDLLAPQKRAIDERIRAVAKDAGVSLQAAGDTEQGIAQAKKVGAACNIESLTCQAQIGVLLGVKQVLVARVSSDWAGDRFELRMLDALRGSTTREATQQLPKDPTLRARVLEGAVLRVLAPAKTGSLAIKAPAGAKVFLDDVAVAADATKVDGLAPGAHDVELRVEGKPPEKKRVDVRAGDTVKVALGPKDQPASGNHASGTGNASNSNGNSNVTPEPTKDAAMWPWVIGGGAVLAAAAGAGAGGLQAALEYSAMERSQRDALQVTGIGLLGATAVGVVVAGAGGVTMAMEAP